MEKVKDGTEQFLRDKTTAIYESDTSIIDVTTGEIVRQQRKINKKTSTEPDYIKVYYKTMMAVHEIDGLPLKFILSLANNMDYANHKDDVILFYNNKTIRRRISTYCDVSDNMVSRYIKKAEEAGILFKTGDRGTYEVNPWLIAKGKWDNIKELQARFDFINGRWERTIEYKEESESDSLEAI